MNNLLPNPNPDGGLLRRCGARILTYEESTLRSCAPRFPHSSGPSGFCKRFIAEIMTFSMILLSAACTQEELVDSGKASIKNTCMNARNCTVYDQEGGTR